MNTGGVGWGVGAGADDFSSSRGILSDHGARLAKDSKPAHGAARSGETQIGLMK